MKYVWIIWKQTKDAIAGESVLSAIVDIHAVCSTRRKAAQENKELHKKHIKSWIGKYLVDHRVHWSPDDTDPIVPKN